MRSIIRHTLLLLTSALVTSSLAEQSAAVPAKAAPSPAPAAAPAPAVSKRPAAPAADLKILQAQVILDRLGFSPGVIDGKQGFTLKLALSAFQSTHDLPATGNLDAATIAALAKVAGPAPVLEVTVSQVDVAGPYVGTIPKREDDQAKLPSLGYSNIMEMLAER